MMMNNNFTKITCLLISLFVTLNSCNSECNVSGIKISNLLNTVSKEKGINYCTLLNKAINGDELAIRKISLLKFNDATGYDQGEILIELILKLGENKYLKSVSNISDNERNLIKSYIDIGFEYSELPNLKKKEFAKVFPKVNEFLN